VKLNFGNAIGLESLTLHTIQNQHMFVAYIQNLKTSGFVFRDLIELALGITWHHLASLGGVVLC
jgi:hypothetical protein